MERLGFNPKEFTYATRHLLLCKCDNKCQVLNIYLEQTQKYVKGTIRCIRPVLGPHSETESKMPKFCRWCGIQTVYLYRQIICPAVPYYSAVYYSDCDDCQLIINRMFEYWENRHPLFKDLSPNDYLKTEIREPIITTKCNELNQSVYTILITMCKFLPKDIAMEILTIQLKLIQKEYRLTIEDFSHYKN